MGENTKSDDYHLPGSTVSERHVLEMISQQLQKHLYLSHNISEITLGN